MKTFKILQEEIYSHSGKKVEISRSERRNLADLHNKGIRPSKRRRLSDFHLKKIAKIGQKGKSKHGTSTKRK